MPSLSSLSIFYLTDQLFGLQFGMLIEFLFEKYPDVENIDEAAIGDLQVSKHLF